MLLLVLDSLLLLFISYNIGHLCKAGLALLFNTDIHASFFENLLLGLTACSVYFGIISLLFPLDYKVLIPLVTIAAYWTWKHRDKLSIWQKNDSSLLTALLLLTILPILVFTFIPPIHPDSPLYHYHAIYWYETERVIPGLGNVHGRLAFNPSSFIISAPFSFTHVVGQSLYPLNPSLALSFYTWLLNTAVQKRAQLSSIVYIITGILLFRHLLSNMSSPTSEPLAAYCTAFVFLKFVDLVDQKQQHNTGHFVILFLLCVFAITAKITSIVLILLLSFWILLIIPRQKLSFYGSLLALGFVVLAPWFTRNVIMSGYLVHPLYNIDFFSFDWKMPKDIAALDYILGTNFVRGDAKDYPLLFTNSNWIVPWFKALLTYNRLIDLLLLLICFSSPLVWFWIVYKRKFNKYFFTIWFCAFTGAVIWFLKSPEFRFGISALVTSFAIPWISLTNYISLKKKQFRFLSILIMGLSSLYYIFQVAEGHPRFHSHGIESLWLKPLKDGYYYKPVDIDTLPYDEVGNGVKIYKGSDFTKYISLRGKPCMVMNYGTVEMRGPRISDGFRSKRNEVRQHFPFVYYKWK